MSRSLTILAFALSFSGLAGATPALDAQGKCRDNGKFVEAKLCAAQKAPAAHCRDVTTKKFAKCGAPNTEPVPVSSAK
jgi:hypothetical protein